MFRGGSGWKSAINKFVTAKWVKFNFNKESKVTIELKIQEGQEELPLEMLVEHIERISNIGHSIKNSRIKQRAVVLLLKDMTGMNIGDIERILDALPRLESEFLKPKLNILDILATKSDS